MAIKWLKRAGIAAIVAAIAIAAFLAMRPQPVPIDVAVIDRGPLRVTIDEEGVVRIRDVFEVSSPIAGQLSRLSIDVGDAVQAGFSEIAQIRPAYPSLHDLRTRRELELSVEAARAAVEFAEAQVGRATAAQQLTQSNLDRARRLADTQTITTRALEEATAAAADADAAMNEAAANLEIRQSELRTAEARLVEPQDLPVPGDPETCCVYVSAPVTGVVLKVLTRSEQVIPAGTVLAEIGDPTNLEAAVNLLSQDAVRIEPGAPADIVEWGGEGTIPARVTRIDPAAFTRVSALGIEEQRVGVILDILDDQGIASRLGHEFRVIARIEEWSADDVVRVPLGALFRTGSDWSVFRAIDGHAVLTRVMIGHRNNATAEVQTGLSAGDEVVLHPSDRIVDGVAVTPRE